MTRRDPQDIEAPLNLSEQEDRLQPPIDARPRPGFLPIQTNWFDRLFIGVVIWVAVSLLWFRFVEPLGASIWISNAIVAALAAVIIWRG